MRKLLPAVIAAAIFFNACKHPSGVHLSQERMAPILADMHLADVYSGMLHDSAQPQSGKNYDSLAAWTAAILARHQTSQTEFNNSMEWYRDNPTELDSLYAQVVPILERIRK